jgi:FkbM family methyltransferase
MIHILDLGANDGCSIRKFKSEFLKNKEYKIYSFEPHPFFMPYLEKEEKNDKKIKFYKKAVSIKNTKTKFYFSEKNDGSTLNKTKTSNGIDKQKYFEVECIDIAYFIKNLDINQNDELWVKMDIEGEEYNIIPHLYKNNLLTKIDKIFIEWHYEKLLNISKEYHDYCLSLLKNKKTYYWDALPYKYKDVKKRYIEFRNNLDRKIDK